MLTAAHEVLPHLLGERGAAGSGTAVRVGATQHRPLGRLGEVLWALMGRVGERSRRGCSG